MVKSVKRDKRLGAVRKEHPDSPEWEKKIENRAFFATESHESP